MIIKTTNNYITKNCCDVVTSYLTLRNEVKPSKLVQDQARDIEIIYTVAETPDKISLFSLLDIFHAVQNWRLGKFYITYLINNNIYSLKNI